VTGVAGEAQFSNDMVGWEENLRGSQRYVNRGAAVTGLVVFFGLLIGLAVLQSAFPSQPLALFDGFYRAGSLVFGGGHVVLPLLQAEVVARSALVRRRGGAALAAL
jgi:hypothetical protein